MQAEALSGWLGRPGPGPEESIGELAVPVEMRPRAVSRIRVESATMLARTLIRSALVSGLVFTAALSTVACGGGQQTDVKTAQVQAGTMPDGGTWEGVYYNQTYGFLHLTVSNGAAQGAWRTTAGDKWGEMYGEIEGDLLRFSWTEHKVGVVGPQAKSEGKGYFLYRIPKEGEAHTLKGEWGLGESDAGHTWD